MGMVPLWGKVGIAAAIVVAGVVTGAIVLAARYQDATNKMAAQAGITLAAAKKIGDAFLTTGGQTTFSAQQMMEAFGPVSGQLGDACRACARPPLNRSGSCALRWHLQKPPDSR